MEIVLSSMNSLKLEQERAYIRKTDYLRKTICGFLSHFKTYEKNYSSVIL